MNHATLGRRYNVDLTEETLRYFRSAATALTMALLSPRFVDAIDCINEEFALSDANAVIKRFQAR